MCKNVKIVNNYTLEPTEVEVGKANYLNSTQI